MTTTELTQRWLTHLDALLGAGDDCPAPSEIDTDLALKWLADKFGPPVANIDANQQERVRVARQKLVNMAQLNGERLLDAITDLTRWRNKLATDGAFPVARWQTVPLTNRLRINGLPGGEWCAALCDRNWQPPDESFVTEIQGKRVTVFGQGGVPPQWVGAEYAAARGVELAESFARSELKRLQAIEEDEARREAAARPRKPQYA